MVRPVGLNGTDAPPPESRPSLQGSCQSGQLTELGKLQAIHLGASLRSRYVDLLDGATTWNPKMVFVRSTNVLRCFGTGCIISPKYIFIEGSLFIIFLHTSVQRKGSWQGYIQSRAHPSTYTPFSGHQSTWH